MSNQSITIMCGLPRCGKSTWIKKHKGDAIVVSADEVRAKIFGHQYHFPAESFVWGIVNAMARIMLDQGKSILIDETSITEKSRHQWVRLAEEYDLRLDIVWIQTPIKECLKRNETSTEGVDKLPEGIIEDKAASFETPIVNERIFLRVVKPHSRSYGQQLMEDFGYTEEEAFKGLKRLCK